MNTRTLLTKLKHKTGLSEDKLDAILLSLADVVIEAVSQGDTVILKNICKLIPTYIPESKKSVPFLSKTDPSFNAQDGKITIKGHWRMRFISNKNINESMEALV